MSTHEESATVASRHAALRWIGVPLFLGGICLVGLAIVEVVGGAPWTRIPLALLATGLGLGSFGANNDTALASALAAGRSYLAPALATELHDELERDRAGVYGLHASPKVGLVMPVVAITLQGWLAWLLLARPG